ncbi:MAG: PAS-domain containing protein [Maricaulaceae bacterium]
MPAWLILSVTTAYVAGLFVIAWRGDRRAERWGYVQSPWIYALGLAVYCTSWTYFGAVGTAVSSGWDYLPIYLGPALVLVIWPDVVRRIAEAAQRENAASLSDFLSARYGKSRGVAALAAIAAVLGALPYIALQLKSVSMSLQALTAQDGSIGPSANESVLLVALAMAAFVILFGARHADATRRNAGLMRVIAFEAIVKLSVLVMVAVLSLGVLADAGDAAPTAASVFGAPTLSGRFITLTLLAMGAILCLPRQFHVAFIQRGGDRDLARARWVFPLYLAATSLVVIPIALAGLASLPAGASPDLFVLHLPLAQGDGWLGLAVFLGGFSAATAMVIVSTMALSPMVTHDLVVPVITQSGRWVRLGENAAARLVMIRRVVILVLVLLAYGYYRVAPGESLAAIGLLSFAAAVQFAPALIGAVYWRGGKRAGVLFGLSAGMLVWAYALFLPAVIGAETMAQALPAALNPQALFGEPLGDPLTHGVVWSLGVNVALFVIVSAASRERLRDRIQAVAFAGERAGRHGEPHDLGGPAQSISPDTLKALLARFLTPSAVEAAFDALETETGVKTSGDAPADWRFVQRAERLLAGALGASSARVVMASLISGSDVDIGDLLSILDHKTQAERFDRHMLQSMLETMSQGISVVDQDQRLVAWNGAYLDLFHYPDDLVCVGRPVEDLIAYNSETGWIAGDPERAARRRLNHMKAGTPHAYERLNPDGRYIRIIGTPMPGGGYVTTYADITADKKREHQLVELAESLEARVRARTHELETMAQDLDAARKDAEGANASKTRFLAAASHDLLQPLNAARLFLGAIDPGRGAAGQVNAQRIAKADRAIQSADNLLKGLLDISRLDHGDIEAHPKVFPIAPLLEDLVDEAAPMAEKAGLSLQVAPSSLWVSADPDFLQSIVRNFLSNARRYTRDGGVLVGARRVGDQVRIEVRDTGPGIAPDRQALLFDEFQRFEDADNMGVRGAGLGLSVARRLAYLMGAEIGVRSTVGRGSAFYLTVPRAAPAGANVTVQAPARNTQPDGFAGLKILCVDDEAAILEAMAALLSRWGCEALVALSPGEAAALARTDRIDGVIADLQLGDAQQDGLGLIDRLRSEFGTAAPCLLLTARADADIDARASARNVRVMRKPADTEHLKDFLASCARARAQAGEGSSKVVAVL